MFAGRDQRSNHYATPPTFLRVPVLQCQQPIADKPRDAFRGHSTSPNMLPLHMIGMVSYQCPIVTLSLRCTTLRYLVHSYYGSYEIFLSGGKQKHAILVLIQIRMQTQDLIKQNICRCGTNKRILRPTPRIMTTLVREYELPWRMFFVSSSQKFAV